MEKEKKQAWKIFDEKVIERVPIIKELFKDREVTEESIKEIWKKNISSSSVPAVIQLGKYVYGIGGILTSEKSIIYTDEDILKPPFLYDSIITSPFFRDILYFFSLCDTETRKKIFNSIYKKYIEGNRAQKEYEELIKKLDSKKDILKFALLAQIIHSRFSVEEIEGFYQEVVKAFNSRLIEGGEKISQNLIEEYDVFYLTYKNNEGKIFRKCYLITKYGVVKDLGFDGYTINDPVRVLAEKIHSHWGKGKFFNTWLNQKVERYKADQVEDKIYEYIMENNDLEECEFKTHFICSEVLEEIFKEIWNGGIPEDIIIKRIVEKEKNYREILYYLVILACGFEMGCMKIDTSKLIPSSLIEKIEKIKTEISGVTSERERMIREKVTEIMQDLEYFFSFFVPFWIISSKCQNNIRKIREQKENIKEEIKNILGKEEKFSKLTLGELIKLISLIKGPEIEKKVISPLNQLNQWRNQLIHPSTPHGTIKIGFQDFEEICKTSTSIYKWIQEEVKFFLIKIKKIVVDSNARKYIEAEEIPVRKKWYITFDEEWIYDEIDPVYLHYMISKTNPIARNPFLGPISLKFEIERWKMKE